MIQLTDLDLLRKVLIKDSHLFINRRVCEPEKSPFPVRFLPTLDYQRRRRSFRTHSLASPRRCLEECSYYCLTDVFDGETESGRSTTFVRKLYNRLLLDVGPNERRERCLQPTSIGIRRQTGDLRLQTVRCSAETSTSFDCSIRVNGQYTLDNISSCLFGVETNSLQNDNNTFINHLKKFSKVDVSKIVVLLIVCK
jgi:hypothetical protein